MAAADLLTQSQHPGEIADQPAMATSPAHFRGECVSLVTFEPGTTPDVTAFHTTGKILPALTSPAMAEAASAALIHPNRPNNHLIEGPCLVSREAVKTVMSGQAPGVMAAVATGRRAGMPDLLTYDLGGTSTDVAMIRNSRAPVSNEIEVEYALPIHVPMVDVRTMGAGCGFIARIQAGRLLRVGPDSASPFPGQIFYCRGGQMVTIFDANLLPGGLSSNKFGAGAAARATMQDQVATPLGLSVEQAAQAVIRIANTHMAGAIRVVSISTGVDPRGFARFAFSGAGPLHAVALARELAVPKVLIHARPGITNAVGCVVADPPRPGLRRRGKPAHWRTEPRRNCPERCNLHARTSVEGQDITLLPGDSVPGPQPGLGGRGCPAGCYTLAH